jgi:signal transduction histidine kinase
VSIAHIYHRTTADQTRSRSLPEDILALDSTDLAQALTQAAALVREAVGAHSVAIMLHDSTLTALRTIGMAVGAPSENNAPMERLIENGGPEVEVYRTGNPHFAHYADGITHRAGDEVASHSDSVLILPLIVGSERRGVVQIVVEHAELAKANTVTELKSAVQMIGIVVKRVERMAHLLQDAAQQARFSLIEDLTSTLNHDLRNMMAPIAGRLDLIRRQASREGHEKYVRHADEATYATRRMQTVLQNLVDVARLEHGTLQLMRQDINLTDLVQQVLTDKQSSTTIAQVESTDAVQIHGDPERIQHSLEYLIGNAFRYSPEDQPVLITIARTEHDGAAWATVSVRDQGVRIAADVLPIIFTRWTTGRGSIGFNLGLYLAYGVAKAHGGTLQVTSDEPTGTTWSLVLPVER